MVFAELSMDDKLALLTLNLQEVLNPEMIEDVLRQDRPLCIYWGTIPFSHFPSRFLPNLEIYQKLITMSQTYRHSNYRRLIAVTSSLLLVPRNTLPTSFC